MKPNARPRLGLCLSTAAFLLMGLAGCAGSPSTQDSTDGSGASAATQVTMDGQAFTPQEVTVTTGATVSWVNQGDMPHDVTGKDNAWQSTGGQAGLTKGASFSKTFDTPGVYEYFCSIHSTGPGQGMWGKVTVQ